MKRNNNDDSDDARIQDLLDVLEWARDFSRVALEGVMDCAKEYTDELPTVRSLAASSLLTRELIVQAVRHHIDYLRVITCKEFTEVEGDMVRAEIDAVTKDEVYRCVEMIVPTMLRLGNFNEQQLAEVTDGKGDTTATFGFNLDASDN